MPRDTPPRECLGTVEEHFKGKCNRGIYRHGHRHGSVRGKYGRWISNGNVTCLKGCVRVFEIVRFYKICIWGVTFSDSENS